MAEVLIFPATNLTGFAQDNTGWYGLEKMPAVVSLTPGENYRVVWDGESFPCTARIVEDVWPGLVYLGDGSALNYPGNNEPFAVGWDEAEDLNVFYSLTDTKESHTVAIYHETSAEVGIIQYDRNGNPMEFYGKKVLRVDTTDGGTRDFVHASLVEKTVELDFSSGDMTVEPGADELFAKVLISKPGTLSQENILEGVNVAGIVGALKAGGGGGSGDFLSGAIQEINCDAQTVLGYLLQQLPNLEVVELPNATTIQKTAYWADPGLFYNCPKLKRFYAPLANTAMTVPAMSSSKNLQEFIFPSWTGSVALSMFAGCTALKTVKLSSITGAGQNSVFSNCNAIEMIDLGKVTSMGTNFFSSGATAFMTLILRAESVVTSSSSNVQLTPVCKGPGYVYVPASMVAAYKADSFWKTYASRIRAIEDYLEICG